MLFAPAFHGSLDFESVVFEEVNFCSAPVTGHLEVAGTELAGPDFTGTELAGPGTPSTEVGAWAQLGIGAAPVRTATIRLRNSIDRRIGNRRFNDDLATLLLSLSNFFMGRFP